MVCDKEMGHNTRKIPGANYLMKHYLVLTVMADDRPGIVERIADAVAAAGGNWLESNMSRLGGKFAGILLVDIAEDQGLSARFPRFWLVCRSMWKNWTPVAKMPQ